MTRHLSLALILLVLPTTQAQILHPTTPIPTFEVATIRPWQAPPPPPPGEQIITETVVKFSPGPAQISDRVRFIGPVEILLTNAFNLPIPATSRIINAPDWVHDPSIRYELNAKIDDTAFAAMQSLPASEQRRQINLMEQSLLIDRLKLKYHFETRELPMYALTVAKGGPKLTPAKPTDSNQLTTVSKQQGSELTARAVTLDQFARSPLLFGQRVVVNQTNLKGTFSFTLRWTPDQQALTSDAPTDVPTLLPALQEQLGLRLIPTKGPVEVIVIDHIERPTSN